MSFVKHIFNFSLGKGAESDLLDNSLHLQDAEDDDDFVILAK